MGLDVKELIAQRESLSAGDAVAAWADDAAQIASILDEGAVDSAARAQLAEQLVGLVESGEGAHGDRVVVGQLLGKVGDPRVVTSDQADYWVPLTLKSGDNFAIGRFPVTNKEYRAFVADGGYERRDLWTDDGWAWLQDCENPWPVLVDVNPDVEDFVVDNQPVVGVSWYEAQAFANWAGARLPRWYERVFAIRGLEKRPYPWGSPFGEGNANSKEEVIERPVAVGLFVRDTTPEGVRDLAGNAGEWTSEQAGDEYLLHPGAWDQPSLACWAKALTSSSPTSRWAALGFRLAKDA